MSVNDVLLPLVPFTPINTILAARCGLSGRVSDFKILGRVRIGGAWRRPGESLQLVDISANRLDRVDGLPGKGRLDIRRNEMPLHVSPNVIKAVATAETKELWITATKLANPEEIMANCSNEVQMEEMWAPRQTGGYSCHDLQRPNFRVTPELFLPEVMCACGPGHFGRSTNCTKCPEDTFNPLMNQSMCVQCPEGSKAPAGSQELSACKCPHGAPVQIGPQKNQTMCLLNNGYIRMERSESIFQCLDLQHCRKSQCAAGLEIGGLELDNSKGSNMLDVVGATKALDPSIAKLSCFFSPS